MTIRENPYAVNEINIFADMHIIMLILIPLMAPPLMQYYSLIKPYLFQTTIEK